MNLYKSDGLWASFIGLVTDNSALVRGKPGLWGHARFPKPGMRMQVTDVMSTRTSILVRITCCIQVREQESCEEED